MISLQGSNRLASTSREPRGGFTLLETLLALALTIAVVSAVQSAVMLHWKYRQAGADQTLVALTRTALIEDITSDLRQARESEVDDVESFSLETVAVGSIKLPNFVEQTEIRERFLSLDSSQEVFERLGFAGEDHWFAMESDGKNHRFTDNAEDLGERVILWFVNRGTPVQIQLHRRDGELKPITVAPGTFPGGLVRVSIDPRELRGITSQQLTTQSGHWQLIEPSVSGIEYRYFDGRRWSQDWDSKKRIGLPMALSITVWREDQEQVALVRLPQSRLHQDQRRGI